MAGELVDPQGMVAVVITTDAAGDSTDVTDIVIGKEINAIRLVDTDLAAGADFTITEQATGQAIMTLTNKGATETWYPRLLVDDGVGAEIAAVYTKVSIGHSRIQVVTADGGDSKTGTIYFLLI
jgi:hypothetical protein